VQAVNIGLHVEEQSFRKFLVVWYVVIHNPQQSIGQVSSNSERVFVSHGSPNGSVRLKHSGKQRQRVRRYHRHGFSMVANCYGNNDHGSAPMKRKISPATYKQTVLVTINDQCLSVGVSFVYILISRLFHISLRFMVQRFNAIASDDFRDSR
jgi:hypothetical protein